jgi:hypothetical protein
MTVEEIECPHFGRMILPNECTICSGKDELEKMRLYVSSRFTAMYDGYLKCGHLVKIGETICRMSGGLFVCEECAEDLSS